MLTLEKSNVKVSRKEWDEFSAAMRSRWGEAWDQADVPGRYPCICVYRMIIDQHDWGFIVEFVYLEDFYNDVRIDPDDKLSATLERWNK